MTKGRPLFLGLTIFRYWPVHAAWLPCDWASMQRRRCVTRQPHDQKPINAAMAYSNFVLNCRCPIVLWVIQISALLIFYSPLPGCKIYRPYQESGCLQIQPVFCFFLIFCKGTSAKQILTLKKGQTHAKGLYFFLRSLHCIPYSWIHLCFFKHSLPWLHQNRQDIKASW